MAKLQPKSQIVIYKTQMGETKVEEGELKQESTVKKFLTVQKEGSRNISRDIEYYNLDLIISVDPARP